jgi:hypothetical protein
VAVERQALADIAINGKTPQEKTHSRSDNFRTALAISGSLA